MPEPAPSSVSSKTLLTAVLITASTLILVVAILVPPYLRSRGEHRRAADFMARAEPVLDAFITAEGAYKDREGKFWRDQEQAVSAEGAKQALGVDIAPATGLRFSIAPPDLVADPTLRIEARTDGEGEALTIACVYDSIARTKSCKQL